MSKELDYIRLDNGKIAILDKEDLTGKGYRFSNERDYAFFDVYWYKVSGYYLIQERSRRRQLVSRFGIKQIMGPYPIEILDKNANEKDVDKRCLELLLNRVRQYCGKVYIKMNELENILTMHVTSN